jgi:RNA polymerase sigma-70 factor (ECF subfamily)
MNNIQSIIAGIRSGNEKAASALVLEYGIEVRCYAAKVAPRPGMAEEIAQDAFIECLQHIERYDASSDFMAWMRGIIRNMARRAWDRIYREEKIHKDGLAEYVEKLTEEKTTESGSSLETRRLQALRRCVKKLSERGKELVKLKYSLQVTCEEIAHKIDTSTDAVKMALCRVRKKLRKCIENTLS